MQKVECPYIVYGGLLWRVSPGKAALTPWGKDCSTRIRVPKLPEPQELPVAFSAIPVLGLPPEPANWCPMPRQPLPVTLQGDLEAGFNSTRLSSGSEGRPPCQGPEDPAPANPGRKDKQCVDQWPGCCQVPPSSEDGPSRQQDGCPGDGRPSGWQRSIPFGIIQRN